MGTDKAVMNHRTPNHGVPHTTKSAVVPTAAVQNTGRRYKTYEQYGNSLTKNSFRTRFQAIKPTIKFVFSNAIRILTI